MDEYYIEGGFPVKGTVKASGNKNAALPCIAAAVLTDQPVTLKNLPEIEDVSAASCRSVRRIRYYALRLSCPEYPILS